jgi:alpha-beta hydrolase superfamily lysophospholipase
VKAVLVILACGVLWVPSLGAQARTVRVSFRSSDGAVLAGSFYEPSARPAPAVILVHMLTRTRRDWEPVAMRLASEGIAVLAFDLRGHGESTPAPTEEGGAPPAMARDVAAASQFLSSRSDVLRDRIGLAGASIGANLALVDAAADPTIRSLVLLSPTLDYRGVRIEASARKYTRPMLLIASRQDAYSWRTVRELTNPKDKAASSRESIIVEGAAHGTGLFARDSRLIPSIVDFFHRTL